MEVGNESACPTTRTYPEDLISKYTGGSVCTLEAQVCRAV